MGADAPSHESSVLQLRLENIPILIAPNVRYTLVELGLETFVKLGKDIYERSALQLCYQGKLIAPDVCNTSRELVLST